MRKNSSTSLAVCLILCLTFNLVISQEQIFDEEPNGQIGEQIDDPCLGCICEGSSDCNLSLQCSEGSCGPFRIAKPYWEHAGSIILKEDNPNDPQAWKRCLNDPWCAGKTVSAFVFKNKKDCNNDGKINCRDYAMIHNLEGFGCGSRAVDPEFDRYYNKCAAVINVGDDVIDFL